MSPITNTCLLGTWGNTYGLRQYEPHTNTCLVRTWGSNTSDLRQYQPHTNTCLVVTLGNTNFILSLYQSQYQLHTCLIWNKNQPWTLIPWPACYVFLLKKQSTTNTRLVSFSFEKIQYQYQLGMFKKLITRTLPAQQWFFLPWYQCRCWLTQGTSSRHWAGSVFKRDVQTIYV